jgi:molecular chaperone DnaK (HSP70)
MVEDAEKYRTEDELRKFAMNSKNNYDKYLNEILRIINNKDLTTDEDGVELFDENELICINKSILSNLEWLENDDEFLLTKEIIDNTRSQFEHSIKGFLNKIYLRKKQIDLKNTYIKEEEKINPEDIADILDKDD